MIVTTIVMFHVVINHVSLIMNQSWILDHVLTLLGICTLGDK